MGGFLRSGLEATDTPPMFTASSHTSSPAITHPARVVALWAVAAVATVSWVKATQIGPVVLVVDEARGWGVHAGDAWALVAVAAAAACTPRAWRPAA